MQKTLPDTLRYALHTLHTLRAVLALALVIASVGLAASVAWAQTGTISGKVTDAKSKEPLTARVYVPAIKRGAAVKPDGSYSFDVPPGTYEVQASYTSYKTSKQTVTVAAGQDATLNFALNEDLVRTAEAVVLGSRRTERTVTESPVPVDVIPAAEMRQTGVTETNQLLQFSVPSFNFPRPTVADGSDHVRPATMRGLGPDQVLVLVNGKRRHVSALVNVNGTVGRGSAGVDLNAIPANAIDRIEVLRDGAAAQYGSDAIAGVINVILRNDNKLSGAVTYGQNTAGDGRVIDVALDYGVQLPNAGFIHASGMFRDRGFSNRAGGDPRAQWTAAQLSADASRSNPDTANSATWPKKFRQGDALAQDGGLFLNASLPVSALVNLYAFGGWTYRNGESAANFRRPNDGNNLPVIYPEGFLPLITSTISDISAALGSKGEVDGWTYDISNTYGQNSFRFGVKNTLNASLGASSPTSFDAGTLFYRQNSINLDIAKPLDIGLAAPLNVAFGGEFRLESYRITAGQPESWWNQPNNIGAQGMFPNRQPNSTGGTGIPAGGSQGFPGFQPKDEANTRNADRNNLAVYLDLETKPLDVLTLGLAGRFENYSDFGSNVTGKLAFLFQPVKQFGLRGSASTGFRAPSLQQSYFSATATNLIAGQLLEVATFPIASPAGKALGAQALKPETSVNFTGGITLEPIDNLVVTVDYYNIQIRDRIIFSGNFVPPTIPATGIDSLLRAAGVVGVAGGRFFTNAVDTRTTGFDITARYGVDLEASGTLRFTAGINFNRNEILNDPGAKTPAQLLALGAGAVLFDRVERTRLERGQPSGNMNFAINYNAPALNNFALMLRVMRFGEISTADPTTVTNPQNPADVRGVFDQTYSARWLTDLDVSIDIVKGVRLAVGANNLFDVYPDLVLPQWQIRNPFTPVAANGAINYVNRNSTAGTVVQYSGQTPFGFNGRYVYGRISFNF
jgi:iron complex outermembrane receptor protein